jgi:hypothetical protein
MLSTTFLTVVPNGAKTSSSVVDAVEYDDTEALECGVEYDDTVLGFNDGDEGEHVLSPK